MKIERTREQTKAYYDRLSGFYDLLAGKSEEPMRRRGLELLQARAGERVLEIGFGTGRALVALARAVGPTGKVYGVDLSEGMLRASRKRLRREGIDDRVTLTLGDALELPYPNSALDAIFMSFVLELFPDREVALVLSECRRVLKPGGRLVVVALSKSPEHARRVRAYEWLHRRFPGLLDCRPIRVQEVIEAAQFDVSAAVAMTVWVPVEIVLGISPPYSRSPRAPTAS